MTKEELVDLCKKVILSTPDGRLVGDRENRFNLYMSSYTGDSGLVYTFPRKIRYADGYLDKRDIMSDRDDAVRGINKVAKLVLGYMRSLKFQVDQEVMVWIRDTELWLRILKKHGLSEKTIRVFEEKYKHLNLKKGYFKQYLRKRYFQLDFYDPIRHLNLEHDGSCWHIPELDAARDEYLLTKFPTLKIERIQDYKPSKEQELREILTPYLEPSYPEPLVFRYDSEIVEQQIIEHQTDLEYILNKLEHGYKLETIQNQFAQTLNRYALKNPASQIA